MQDPTLSDMLTYLKGFNRQHGCCDTDPDTDDCLEIHAAIYWYAADYHAGQSSNLYAALSTSPYRPARSARSVQQEDEATQLLYQALEERYR